MTELANRVTVLTPPQGMTLEQEDKLFNDWWEAFYHWRKAGFITRVVVEFVGDKMVYRKE